MNSLLPSPQLPYQPNIHVFIGFDDRELIEYNVAKWSIISKLNSPNVKVYPLQHKSLRKLGLFYRKWITEENGQMIDADDKKPFSTQFSFTRFLVPHYAKLLKIDPRDYVVFHDSDFLHLKPITNLFLDIPDITAKSIWVVKHNYKPENTIKMDNIAQMQYNRKNWSSFIVFNTGDNHPGAGIVNSVNGSYLHQFKFYNDDDIGELPEKWNFIPDHSEPRVDFKDVQCIHYTEATPMMKPWCKYNEEFFDTANKMLTDYDNNVEELIP